MHLPAGIQLQTLVNAYSNGVFPMADAESGLVSWFSADPRAIFPIIEGDPAGQFKVPRSLSKTCRSGKFEIRVNTAFDQVIRYCASVPHSRLDPDPSTWISEPIIDVFERAHARGFAHCIEAWLPAFRDEAQIQQPARLVGGLYGLALGGAFFGESMFSLEPNASKVCLVALVTRLRKNGFTLLDTQMSNPHLEQFGVVEIDAAAYRDRLQAAVGVDASFIN